MPTVAARARHPVAPAPVSSHATGPRRLAAEAAPVTAPYGPARHHPV
ncbi:hypothetical protein [Streptomyces minutiscleroticus]|nr:hypothetical protein [Streptomyces minutiscleroticus]